MSGTPEMRAQVDRLGAEAKPSFYGFLNSFRRLDQRLKRLLDEVHSSNASGAEAQPFPGLAISQGEVIGLLNREPGELVFPLNEDLFGEPLFKQSDNSNSQLAWLAQEYDLSPFDLDLILIALATELDLRYERIFAYLQDDITCKRPCVDLALSLLCPSASARQVNRARLSADAPLIKSELLRLLPDPDH